MLPIHTDRLIIRQFTPQDGDDLYEMITQYHASGYAAYDQPWPKERDAIHGVAKWFSEGEHFLAVCLQATGKVIGFVAVNPREEDPKPACNMGYVFNFDYHRQGYATEACRALIRRAFCQVGVKEIRTGTHPANAPSVALLTKLGFEHVPGGRWTLTRAMWRSPSGTKDSLA